MFTIVSFCDLHSKGEELSFLPAYKKVGETKRHGIEQRELGDKDKYT